MPLHCVGDRRSPTEVDDEEETCQSIWQESPDSILLHMLSFLDASSLVSAAQTCKVWHRVASDESLWKALVQGRWNIKNHTLPTGKVSWKQEYKRLFYHTPIILSETLRNHGDEVLHVSFSHSGEMFSTTSKDATIKVWQVGYPTELKYNKDFRELLKWDFTQFSCFNKSDSMLLVSSVKTTDYMDRRGYVAILSLIHDFQLLRVISMDPSQLFGAWLDDSSFLGGYLEISLDRFATTVQIESFEVDRDATLPTDVQPTIEEGVGQNLFTFCSETASLIKFLTVANVPICHKCRPAARSCDKYSRCGLDSKSRHCDNCDITNDIDNNEDVNIVSCNLLSDCSIKGNRNVDYCDSAEGGNQNDNASSLEHLRMDSVEFEADTVVTTDVCSYCKRSREDASESYTRNLIFVTGEFAVALHQLGFKNVSPSFVETMHKSNSQNRNLFDDDMELESEHDQDQEERHMVVNFSNNDIQLRRVRKSDKPDNLIDLHGHVTGLCLSRDHRYLYLNCRPWIGKVDRSDPWATPDLSQAIEVRVIDLWTLQDMGVRYTGHLGFSPSTMCCFVFLDVSADYVGSGSEDAKGYLWDRHYGVNLTTYEHDMGVVNAVGFNPWNQEYLVTVSDDNTIKVWRSRSEMTLNGQVFSVDDMPKTCEAGVTANLCKPECANS